MTEPPRDASAPPVVRVADEFTLIDRILAEQPAGLEDGVRVAAGDDAAVITPPAGAELVVSVDTLVEDVHFLAGTAPALVVHRALAVNLSDLAAMGAAPGPCLLALVHPDLDPATATAIGRGFAAAAAGTGARLVGGNLARGPLSLSVTVQGWVPRGEALLRAGARPGDLVCVSGILGAGAAGLAALLEDRDRLAEFEAAGDVPEAFRAYLTPIPRLGLGRALRRLATACIDVSDGLLADLGHLLRASGVGAELDLERIPCTGPRDRALVAGDDYELLFTIPAPQAGRLEALAASRGLPLTVIGRITAAAGLVLREEGRVVAAPDTLGWDHLR